MVFIGRTLLGQVLARFVDRDTLVRLDLIIHDNLSTLEVEDDLAALNMPEYDAHPLALRGERKVSQDFILLSCVCRVLYHYPTLVPLYQLDAQRMVGELHQSDLIWRACLELSDRGVLGVRVSRRHVVAERQTRYHVSHHLTLVPPLLLAWPTFLGSPTLLLRR